jgi:hypothetical protein
MPAKKKLAAKKMTKALKRNPRSAVKAKAVALRKRRAPSSPIAETAKAFFVACEAGRGWEGCSAYARRTQRFPRKQSRSPRVKTLREYTEWMKGLMATLTDGRYELRSFAADPERNNVCAYGRRGGPGFGSQVRYSSPVGEHAHNSSAMAAFGQSWRRDWSLGSANLNPKPRPFGGELGA